MGQDWSEIWLQKFSGTVTVWPKSVPSDFLHILSDPTPERLARMLHFGKQSAFPKLLFIKNRLKIESAIMKGLQKFSLARSTASSPIISRRRQDQDQVPEEEPCDPMVERLDRNLPERFSNYKDKSHYAETSDTSLSADSSRPHTPDNRRRSFMEEVRRQSAVFFDNPGLYGEPDGVPDGDK